MKNLDTRIFISVMLLLGALFIIPISALAAVSIVVILHLILLKGRNERRNFSMAFASIETLMTRGIHRLVPGTVECGGVQWGSSTFLGRSRTTSSFVSMLPPDFNLNSVRNVGPS